MLLLSVLACMRGECASLPDGAYYYLQASDIGWQSPCVVDIHTAVAAAFTSDAVGSLIYDAATLFSSTYATFSAAMQPLGNMVHQAISASYYIRHISMLDDRIGLQTSSAAASLQLSVSLTMWARYDCSRMRPAYRG